MTPRQPDPREHGRLYILIILLLVVLAVSQCLRETQRLHAAIAGDAAACSTTCSTR